MKKTLYLYLCMLLVACSDRGDSEVETPPIGNSTPDSFLSFVNTQAPLSVGDYEIIAGTAMDNQTGSYNIKLIYSNGQVQTFSDDWGSTSASDPFGESNTRHSFSLDTAMGLSISLDSSVDAALYLLKNNSVVAFDDNSGEGHNPFIDLPLSLISNKTYAQAYYQAVDPQNQRTTLADWKSLNGFDQGADTHVVFRDSKDLGYGRNMFMRSNENGQVAIFVENYIVKVIEGDTSNYGPLNVYAAVEENKNYHIGTNAIEFSPVDPSDPDSDKILKFFTFAPADTQGIEKRALKGNLDGRGIKHIPGPCLVCHGGHLAPLNVDGSFPLSSLMSAKFNMLEVSSFEFADIQGFEKIDQQSGLKAINQQVHQSYLEMKARDTSTPAHWHADFAAQLVSGHYGDDFSLDVFQENAVPAGWRQTTLRPEGVELLYSKVVGPHCIGCHSLRGNSAGEAVKLDPPNDNLSLANAVNFSSYEKFISFNDRIIDYVYRRGVMPLSLRNYEKFWWNPDGAPALLASYLQGFDLQTAQGKVVEPGKPVANAGSDRDFDSTTTLDAGGSLFASQYRWRLIDGPAGADASLTNADQQTAQFRADLEGEFRVGLMVSNDTGDSQEQIISLMKQPGLSPSDAELNFVDHIRPVLGSELQVFCAKCHRPDSPHPGIPVYYDDSNVHLYEDVLSRVDILAPENSPLLIKPTSLQHGGGIQLDLTDPGKLADYKLILRWIRQGAVCGDDSNICPLAP